MNSSKISVQAALNLLGSTVVASYSVSCKVEQLVTQPFAAMGVTMATYCAQNRGINDLNRIRKGVKAANIMSGVYAVLVYGLVYIALPYIVPLFISEQVEMVCGYARTYITICGMFFIPLGMMFIFRNALQGCGFGFMPRAWYRGFCGSASDELCGCVLCQCLSLADRRYFPLDRLSFPYEEDGEGQKGS